MGVKVKRDVEGNREMDVDEIYELSGSCGRFQLLSQSVFTLLVLCIGFHPTMTYFTASNPPWKCAFNCTNAFCRMNFNKTFPSDSDKFFVRCHMNRSDWLYVPQKTFSFVTEFDLVCDKASLAAFGGSAFFIGGLIGCILTGIAADKYGRKIVLIGSLFSCAGSSIGVSYVANIWQLIVLRGILGAAQMTAYCIGFVCLSEFIPPTRRTVSGNVYQVSFCFSQLMITAAACLEKNWRHLQLYASFPAILPLIGIIFLPESPRWMVMKGRHTEAKITLKKIASYNKVSWNNLILKSPQSCDGKTYTYLDFFKHKKLVILTFALGTIWVTVLLFYMVISLISSNLGGDMYQAFALSTLADFPGYFISLYVCNRFGRKKSVLGSNVLAGLMIGSLAAVPQSLSFKYVVNITLAMFAKLFTNLSFVSVYIWTLELYPTVMRSQGMSLCVAFERMGGIAAPFFVSVLQKVHYVLPFLVMCGIAFTSSGVGLVLAETNRLPTRERYEDMFDNYEEVEGNGRLEIGCANEGLENTKNTRM